MGSSRIHEPDNQATRELLKLWRKQASLTMRELGDLLGKPHSYVQKSEIGERRVDPPEFFLWAMACGVEPQHATDLLIGKARLKQRLK